MYGVLTPQHLNRLGLINDSLLYTYNHDNSEHPVIENLSNNGEQNNNTEEKIKNENNNDIKEDTKETDVEDKEKEKVLIDPMRTENTKESDTVNKLKAEDVPFQEQNKMIENNIYKSPPKLFEDKDITTDTMLLLKQALNKLPQIPFSLLIDEYRWKYFEGNLKGDNQEFWSIAMELQGIAPPGFRGEEYFDVGAKFHVPDNTPYIRY